ncbi:AMP-binding protein [Streptomyces sp. SID8352]|uniref:AMP-binding protein n=1 Tax=Streptomyces sp. SID8352 TaxID=2690338 RepID=UPI00136F5F1F|nr:AMP-binding protein [Streptomyces sp. SID8352]MYU21284.1 AMP-binding protein [Streptomyces sp. SID8352]
MNGPHERNAGWWYLDRHLGLDTADAVCLISEEGELTYRELHGRVCRFARVLAEGGVRRGDRVVLVLPDTVAFVATVLAAMRMGAVPVPIAPLLTLDEQRHVIEDCAPSAVLLEDPEGELAADFHERFPGTALWSRRPGDGSVRCLPAEAEAAEPLETAPVGGGEDPALFQYTSGSTGRSKGVVHAHRGLLAFAEGVVRRLGLTRRDRFLSMAKMPFGYGFGNSLLMPFAVGGSAVITERRSDPYAAANLLRAHRPTVFCAVPTLYAAMLAVPRATEQFDFSPVRLALSAGEHLGAGLSNRLTETFGLSMVNGLGSTECLHFFVSTEPGVSAPGVTGEPVPTYEVEVLDDEGRVLPPGSMGRMRVRGPANALGYWNRPQLTAETFRDGWFHTGDNLRYEPGAGWVYLGRDDNILNVGGGKVLTSEIEEVILPLEGVASCAVVGVPDENELIRIVAYVVPEDPGHAGRPGAPGEPGRPGDEGLRGRVMAAVRASLPPHKRPQRVRLVDAVPTTSTGKTARFLIRQREMERRS